MEAISAEDIRSGRETSVTQGTEFGLSISQEGRRTVFQIDVRTEVHFVRDGLEDEPLFSS